VEDFGTLFSQNPANPIFFPKIASSQIILPKFGSSRFNTNGVKKKIVITNPQSGKIGPKRVLQEKRGAVRENPCCLWLTASGAWRLRG